MSWNHNNRYHDAIVSAIPPTCGRALDIGCGQGGLARKLAKHCQEVIALDVDHDCLERAKAAAGFPANLAFVHGDVLTAALPEGSFDFVSAIATLHHLPLQAGLLRIRNLLRPGGVIALVGLYRAETLMDYAFAAAAFPLSRVMRLLRSPEHTKARLKEPVEGLAEILKECNARFPGGTFRRRLFFRYTFVGRKPFIR